jgi:hypothetical protein
MFARRVRLVLEVRGEYGAEADRHGTRSPFPVAADGGGDGPARGLLSQIDEPELVIAAIRRVIQEVERARMQAAGGRGVPNPRPGAF